MKYLGFILFGFLVVGLTFVYFQRRSREKAMKAFYEENSLFLKENNSAKVRGYLQIDKNPDCAASRIYLADGSYVPVYWCEWFIKIEHPGRTTASVEIEYYLSVFFAPNTVSEEFMQKATAFADKSEIGAMQKIKDQFTPDTHYPFRAEKLPDGTFIIGWQMQKRRELYESKIEWLKNNLSAAS